MDMYEVTSSLGSNLNWINSLPIASCAVVSSLEDISSGVVLSDIVAFLVGRKFLAGIDRSAIAPSSSLGNIRKSLSVLETVKGYVPKELMQDNAPEKIFKQDVPTAQALIAFLRYCFGEGPDPTNEATERKNRKTHGSHTADDALGMMGESAAVPLVLADLQGGHSHPEREALPSGGRKNIASGGGKGGKENDKDKDKDKDRVTGEEELDPPAPALSMPFFFSPARATESRGVAFSGSMHHHHVSEKETAVSAMKIKPKPRSATIDRPSISLPLREHLERSTGNDQSGSGLRQGGSPFGKDLVGPSAAGPKFTVPVLTRPVTSLNPRYTQPSHANLPLNPSVAHPAHNKASAGQLSSLQSAPAEFVQTMSQVHQGGVVSEGGRSQTRRRSSSMEQLSAPTTSRSRRTSVEMLSESEQQVQQPSQSQSLLNVSKAGWIRGTTSLRKRKSKSSSRAALASSLRPSSAGERSTATHSLGKSGVMRETAHVALATSGKVHKHKHSQKGKKAARFGVAPLTLEQEAVVEWLRQRGVNIQPAKAGELTEDDVVHSLMDGVQLCIIVQNLSKVEIQGLEAHPKTVASYINNVNRALAVLRDRKNMNPRHLWATHSIVNKDTSVVWELIADLQQEFKDSKAGFRARYNAKKSEVAAQNGTDPATIAAQNDEGVWRQLDGGTAIPLDKFKLKMNQTDSVLPSYMIHEPSEPISQSMEKEVRSWLSDLHFDILEKDEKAHAMEDPFRNGTLLCDLVNILEDSPIQKISRHPKTVIAARGNVERALAVLRRKNNIPSQYLWNPDGIVQGMRGFIFGLLYHIKRAYPTAPIPTTAGKHSRSIYSPEVLSKLETSLLIWIYSLGVIPGEQVPARIDDLKEGVTNGTLLCDIVSIMQGKNIAGTFNKPKTVATCQSNIRRACETLRRFQFMRQRFLWQAESIYDFDKMTVLGLLEDMHRCFDGVKPPKLGSEAEEEAYLGKGTLLGPQHRSIADKISHMHGERGKLLGEYMHGKVIQEGARTMAEISRPVSAPTELRPLNPSPTKIKIAQTLAAGAPQPFAHHPMENQNPFDEGLLGAPVFAAMTASLEDQDSFVTSMQQMSRRIHQSHHSGLSGGGSSSYYQPDYEPTSGYLLCDWIRTLGVNIPSTFSLDAAVILDFADGVLLCDLVSKLEHSEITGVERNAKRRGAQMHNINLALAVLRKRRNMPIQYLWSHEEIHKGNPIVILGLLEQLRRAYQHIMPGTTPLKSSARKLPVGSHIAAPHEKIAGVHDLSVYLPAYSM
jgi:hypothetical protein